VIGAVIAVAILAVSAAVAAHRMFVGPDDAQRAMGSDLLFFAFVGLTALGGLLVGSPAVFDLIIVATVVGFLASISLARAVTSGRR
jgi:multicomponent Na+:H+ antiporter subunit F